MQLFVDQWDYYIPNSAKSQPGWWNLSFEKATVIALAKIPILIEIRYHAKNGFEWYAFEKLERNVTNQS